MSDTKISALPDGGAVQSTDEFVAARAGTNVKIEGSAIGSGGGGSFNGGTITGGLTVDVVDEDPALSAGGTIVEGSGATTIQTTRLGDYSLQVNDDAGALLLEAGPGALALLQVTQISVPAGGLCIVYDSSNNPLIQIADSGAVQFIGAPFQLFNLPTSDPAVVGQVWNSSGTLKVSAG